MKFEELGLLPQLLQAVVGRGYTKCTPIQEQAIPAVLKGRDVLGGAQTGTGKTAAFALPILQQIHKQNKISKNPLALVLTPTRELALQVGESFTDYGNKLSLKCQTVFGGVNINPQIQGLKKGCDIVVATPGRLLDHLQQRTINLSDIQFLVLDEADRMLDMGFIRDIRKIISFLPEKRQNLLFSATYSKEIRKLSADLLDNPVNIEVAPRNSAAEQVNQYLYKVDKRQKRHLLAHLIKEESWYQVLVFVRTKHGANRLCKQLDKQGIPSSAIHGDKSQNARVRALNSFKKGDLQALIATDVAARGIHLEDLGHVVNFDLPQVPEDYVHRIGRTGRAGKSGSAITLVSPDENAQLKRIEAVLKKPIGVMEAKDFSPVVLTPEERLQLNPGKSQRPGNSRTSERSSSQPKGRFNRNSVGSSSRDNRSNGFSKGRNDDGQRDNQIRTNRPDNRPNSSSKGRSDVPNRDNQSRSNRPDNRSNSSTKGRSDVPSRDNKGRSNRSDNRPVAKKNFRGARNAVLEATSWDAV
ncbi:MAG: DEAD/DEAH box helicase [Spirochaetaceae bacterium]|jgi:ATP-dependent RNA helicase RhlE|nr:DEAD/DEAH box helicase [Spirochaetaceae bacterium]